MFPDHSHKEEKKVFWRHLHVVENDDANSIQSKMLFSLLSLSWSLQYPSLREERSPSHFSFLDLYFILSIGPFWEVGAGFHVFRNMCARKAAFERLF